MPAAPSMETLLSTFTATERLLDIHLTVGDHTGIFRGHLPPERLKHDLPACLDAKRSRTAACLDCETRLRIDRLRESRTWFIKTCHAGFAEVTLPIWPEEPHAGSLAAGLFVWRTPQDCAAPVMAQSAVRGAELPNLPLLKPARAADLAFALSGLAALLREWHAAHAAVAPQDHPRKEHVAAFIRSGFRARLTLPQLAAELHLSTSRAGHLVQELFGQSFVELVRAARLDYARRLLAGSSLPIAEVSSLCGFPEPRQLHIAFRETEGMTPRQWRIARQRLDAEQA